MWAFSVRGEGLFRSGKEDPIVNLKIVCAWCQKHLGDKEVLHLDKELPPITHSICPVCHKRVFGEFEAPKQSDQTATNCHEKEIVK
jgi:hypothetical protein